MDWSKIDSSTFEKLCCEYANKEYSDLIWEPTGQSWDNNRDGEFQEKIKRLNRTFKGWYECKYTYDSNNVIPKSHMDSTLVSGILDGEVIYILFITNGRITSEFRQRAFAILRPHQIEVNFIDGEMLEKWIENNTEIYYAYFHEKIQNQSKKQTVSIDDIKIFDSVFFSPNFLCPVKEIIVSKEYFIYICVKASAQFSFTVKLSTSNLRILDQRLYTVYPGYNNVLIRCVAKNTCKKQTIGFSLLEEGTKKVLCNKRIENFCIEPSQCPEIIYYSQTKIMQEMFNYINTNSHNNRILALAAEGGMGKSYLVQNLIASLIKPNSLFMGGYFSEKTAENACVLCKLILFLSFGTLYELNEESFLLLVEQYTSMPISLLLLLKTGTYNQIVATSAISKYYDYLNNNQDISSYVGGFNEKFWLFTTTCG